MGTQLTQYHSPAIFPLVRNTSVIRSLSVPADGSACHSTLDWRYSSVIMSGESAGNIPSASAGSSTAPFLTRTTILLPSKRFPVNAPSLT